MEEENEKIRRRDWRNLKRRIMSRSLIVDFTLFFFLFILFYFILFYFISIFRTTRVRVYQSRCHIKSQVDGKITRLITRLEKRK